MTKVSIVVFHHLDDAKIEIHSGQTESAIQRIEFVRQLLFRFTTSDSVSDETLNDIWERVAIGKYIVS
jgi:hypothetical protein